jgi:hypothetical protein
LFAGATNASVICASFPVALVIVGASGTVTAGTAAFEGPEGALVPSPLLAVTLHVYVAPLVRPFTMIGLPPPVAEPLVPPFDDVHDAVKPVMPEPPSSVGPLNETLSDTFRLVAEPIDGASGTVAMVVALDTADGPLVPFADVARTVHVYVRPFESAGTTTGLVAPEAAPLVPPFDETHNAV